MSGKTVVDPIDMIVELRSRCTTQIDKNKLLECIEELRKIINEVYIPALVNDIKDIVEGAIEGLKKEVRRCRTEKCLRRKIKLIDEEIADLQIYLDELWWYVET
jgi:hypothetical protein